MTFRPKSLETQWKVFQRLLCSSDFSQKVPILVFYSVSISLCSDNPQWCHLCVVVTGHKGPCVLSHLAIPTLSFVTVKSRNAGGKEEAGKRENEEKREEGEHFYTLN